VQHTIAEEEVVVHAREVHKFGLLDILLSDELLIAFLVLLNKGYDLEHLSALVLGVPEHPRGHLPQLLQVEPHVRQEFFPGTGTHICKV
jgi:hypothetical protein